MSSDRPDSKPDLPAMPLDRVVEAAEELGTDSKLKRALILLVTKIDKGFSSMLFYMRNVRERIAAVARKQEDHEERIRGLEDRLTALESWRHTDERLDVVRDRENTAKTELARIQGQVAVMEREEKRADEWKQLDTKWKIAILGGVFGISTAMIAGAFKVAEILLGGS